MYLRAKRVSRARITLDGDQPLARASRRASLWALVIFITFSLVSIVPRPAAVVTVDALRERLLVHGYAGPLFGRCKDRKSVV